MPTLTPPHNFSIFTDTPELAELSEMIYVEGGSFMMGSDDDDAYEHEKPIHKVKLNSFFIGKYPVTQALHKHVMNGESPSRFKGDRLPVGNVSWPSATEFCYRLKEMTKYKFRLPTEEEWEYAARGGEHWKDNYKYAGGDNLNELGWYEENSHEEIKPVGLKLENQLGIHDMSGNVWEVCEDHWHGSYVGAPDDGTAKNDNKRSINIVNHGGSWVSFLRHFRISFRGNYAMEYPHSYNHGFRVAISSGQ